MKKYSNLILNVILLIIILIIFTLKINKIIIYDYYTNALIIALISIIWIVSYFKSFSKLINAIWWIFMITFFTMFVHLSILENIIKNDIIIKNGQLFFTIELIIITAITIKLLEWNIFNDINRIIKIFLSYILTMIFIWHFLLTSWINWGLYFKDLELLETKCISEKCIDIYNAEFKYNYINIYYYDKKNSIIKYNWKNPNLGFWNNYHKEKLNKVKNIIHESIFSIENWNYILNYEDLKWEKKKIIINS